ncbi:MAG: Uma2 family endonuclease [Candidatus Eremiobacterota bacterium]
MSLDVRGKTYEEYLAEAEGPALVEWENREIVRLMPPKRWHQDLVLMLGSLMGHYTALLGLGRVLVAPFEMKIRPDGNAREPDVLFVASEHLDRLAAERLNGPADLIVEVLSDDSASRDRGEKFYEYEEGGVGEYWLCDPRPGKQRIEGYRLEGGRYRPLSADARGRLCSSVLPGFWFEEAWLTADRLPDPLALLAAMAPDALRRAWEPHQNK